METTGMIGYAIIITLAYLAGSIPSGVLLTAFFSDEDIRKKGSGNIGATNVARVAGKRLGLLTLVFDLLKGGVPVYLAGRFGAGIQEISMTLAALASVCGHMYPVYSRFKGGGKGVATAGGCFLVMARAACLAAIIVFVLVVWMTRRVSAGSIAAALSLPPAVWFASSSVAFSVGAGVVCFFVVLRHRENIIRLANGEEPPFFGSGKQKNSDQQ